MGLAGDLLGTMMGVGSRAVGTALLGLLMTTGCATRYILVPLLQDGLPANVSLPDGAADRVIVRLDNASPNWLHIDWSGARIVGLTGFSVPVRVEPSTPLSSLPPQSSVEYHLFPAHDYWPDGRFKQRRESVVSLLVYDTDFETMTINGSETPVIELYVPICTGGFDACCATCDSDGSTWGVGHLRAKVERVVQ